MGLTFIREKSEIRRTGVDSFLPYGDITHGLVRHDVYMYKYIFYIIYIIIYIYSYIFMKTSLYIYFPKYFSTLQNKGRVG